jgi:hypothetical protein
MVVLDPDPESLAGLDFCDDSFALKFRTSRDTSSRHVVLWR